MQRPDLETAIRIYHTYSEIGNREINELFGGMSSNTRCKYKKKIRERMAAENVSVWNPSSVNTKIAYEVFKIDIEDLEKRRARLIKLGLYSSAQEVIKGA